MPLPPETRLLRTRKPRANDVDLALAVCTIPSGGSRERTRIGVLNESGRLYREVVLYSAMQAFHLRARTNALGMRYVHTRRLGKFLTFDAVIT
jgi:hypothetical protein